MLRPSILKTWERLLHERPIAVNSLQGAGLAAFGDVVAQRIEGSSTVDWRQCAMATAAGAALGGVFVPYFYRALDVAFPGTGLRSVLSKTASDIAVQGCFVNAALLVARGAPASSQLPASASASAAPASASASARASAAASASASATTSATTSASASASASAHPHSQPDAYPSPGESVAEVRRDMPQVLLHDCCPNP